MNALPCASPERNHVLIIPVVLSICLLVVATLSLVGWWVTWISVFSNFTHITAFLGWLLGVYGFAFMRGAGRSITMFLALAVGLSSTVVVLSAPGIWPSAIDRSYGSKVKVVQFNLKPGRDDEDAIVEWLTNERPDVVILQDLTTSLSDRLSVALPELTLSCTHQCQVAMASRFPLRRQRSYGRGGYGLTPATLVSHVQIEGMDTIFVATHLARPTFSGKASPTEMVQVQSANISRLKGILSLSPRDRMIVIGDMNAAPWSWPGIRLQRALSLPRRTSAIATWPAVSWMPPILPIDHVYAGQSWQTIQVRRGPRLGSDHYPVVVTLGLSSAA